VWFPVAAVCNVSGIHRSSYKYWWQPKKFDVTRVILMSLLREVYCQGQGSAGARSIAAMVTTKGIKLSHRGNCWDNSPMEWLFRNLKTAWVPDNVT